MRSAAMASLLLRRQSSCNLTRSVVSFRPVAYRLLGNHRQYPEIMCQKRSPFSSPPENMSQNRRASSSSSSSPEIMCQKRSSFSSPPPKNMSQKRSPFSSALISSTIFPKRSWISAAAASSSNSNVGLRSCCYSSIPVVLDPEWMKKLLAHMPVTDSVSFTSVDQKHMIIQVPGLEKVENAEGSQLSVSVDMDPFPLLDMNARVDGKFLLVHAQTEGASYVAGMKLPPKYCNKNIGRSMRLLKHDEAMRLTFTLPKLRFAFRNRSFSDFIGATIFRMAGRQHYFVYSELLFDRSYLREQIFPRISSGEAWCRSFTNYEKKEADGSIYIKMSGDLAKKETTSQALCVSLSMPGFQMEDVVEASFENRDNIFVVEARRGMEHYVWGVLIPEGYDTSDGMVNTEMPQGVYKVTFPTKQATEG